MKKVKIKYGKSELEVEVPNHAEILTPPEKPPQKEEMEILTEALGNPIDSPKIEEFIKPSDDILVVVPDKTRKAKVGFVLNFILERIKCRDIRIIFATGTHQSQTEWEKIEILGEEIYKNFKVLEHDCFNSKFKFFGITSRGTEIFLNEVVSDADRILLLGSITHHYFAGFGGGAKMIVPGLASYQTAIQNHKLTLTSDGDINPNATNLKLDGNPVYEDIVEAFKICNLKAFHIGVVVDETNKIVGAFCGDVISSHKAGADFLKRFFTIPVKEKFDVVISSAGGFPKDVNLIQSHKTIHHSHYIVKNGGEIFCFVECRDGIGSKTFLDWFKFKDIGEMKRNLREDYSMNGHTALSLLNKLKIVNITLKTSLPVEILNFIGLGSLDSIDVLREINGTVAIIQDASTYLPTYCGG